jgi:S-adenosylmethionine synthetase
VSTAPARPPAVEGAIVLEALPDAPVARRRVELVERKGIGHPDTICDCLVEAISVALNAMYLERVGVVPHYNIDKALLIAGQAAKGFGWGELTRPMELIVGDRATFVVGGLALPVEDTARAAVDTLADTAIPARSTPTPAVPSVTGELP